jgi:hypothetical protein
LRDVENERVEIVNVVSEHSLGRFISTEQLA